MVKKILWAICITLLAVLFIGGSIWRYMVLNEAGYFIEETTHHFGEEVAMGKLTYKIGKPRIKKVYAKEYDDYVNQYFIPFEAENKTTNSSVTQKVTIDDLVIVSAGSKWQVDPFASADLGVNRKLKKKLQPGEKTSGEMLIEIPIDKKGEGYYTADVLKNYQLYFVEHHKRGADKYKFQN
ncbi:hypothetical protein ACYRFS_08985 [Listeria kieliensis]|uniref:DUF4352 domain-containing protein n=1 Tax=Listeria kieliensis TaxID=1621700 RepID=A0A3D8TR55_9LIST|nr:hypothetical protein [Listeria kieliensis]RDX01084.1 hypothetical protein UR08_09030 [Listeria kieliensis]